VPEQINWKQLTGVAGVHYFAYLLNYWGYAAVPTARNINGPDLLVTNRDGSKMIAIQVKTSASAMRTRGRGEMKKPNHYEWDIGWASARINCSTTYFGLVDLRENEDEYPIVFLVPSKVIYEYFEAGDPTSWPRARFHPSIEEIEKYKVDLNLLKTILWKNE
jgi:hypothetical protein